MIILLLQFYLFGHGTCNLAYVIRYTRLRSLLLMSVKGRNENANKKPTTTAKNPVWTAIPFSIFSRWMTTSERSSSINFKAARSTSCLLDAGPDSNLNFNLTMVACYPYIHHCVLRHDF